MSSYEQLTLHLGLSDNALLDNYYPADNLQAFNQLKKTAAGLDPFFLYLWGAQGSGCTHLLQGACHLATQQQRSAMYLPLANNQKLHILDSLEQIDLVCIDNIQVIAGDPVWEQALFHLYNRIKDSTRTHLIIAADCAPMHLPFTLPDLQSRINAGLHYHIEALSDENKYEALALRAKQRGLELSPTLGRFILRRATRNMGELYELLDKLDKAALSAQRRLTIPFVRSLNLL